MKSYGMTEVLELLADMPGSNYAHAGVIQRWRSEGCITPSIAEASGSGTRTVWSELDVDRIRALFRLLEQFHTAGLQLPFRLVRDGWDTLGRGEPWQLCFDLSLVPA